MTQTTREEYVQRFQAQCFAKLVMTAHTLGLSDEFMARRLGVDIKEFCRKFYAPEKYTISDLSDYAAAMGYTVKISSEKFPASKRITE